MSIRCSRRTDGTDVLLEALKISGTEQRDDPRFPSKKHRRWRDSWLLT